MRRKRDKYVIHGIFGSILIDRKDRSHYSETCATGYRFRFPSGKKGTARPEVNMASDGVKMTLEDQLLAFGKIAAAHLEKMDFLEKYYLFFQDFFKADNLRNAEWEDFQKLGDHIHAFQALALSRKKALGNPNHPIEHYRKVFLYLVSGEEAQEERIRKIFIDPEYNIRYFGESVWSEIIGQLFADTYVLFNHRDRFALKLLGIDPGFARGDTFPDQYFKFNTAIQPVIEAYERIVGSKTNLPINLEVDQFFSFLYEAYHEVQSDFVISEIQMDALMERFRLKYPDFADFTRPGDALKRDELDYKHKALSRFQTEIGMETLKQWLAEGQGQKATVELNKRISTNMIQFNSWRLSIGNDDTAICEILQAFIQTAEQSDMKPGNLKPIFVATQKHGLKPAWDTLSVLLWILNPKLYAPVKIRYFRGLATELGQELPIGRPSAQAYCRVMEWTGAFRKALEPYNPGDWIDVQSFIWVVCPESDKEIDETNAYRSDQPVSEDIPLQSKEDSVDNPSFYWLYINPRIWDPSTSDIGRRQTYTAVNEKGHKRRIYKYFENINAGDILVGYESTPRKAITSLFRVTSPLQNSSDGKKIEFELIEKIAQPIGLNALQANPVVSKCEAFRNSQGSLFYLTKMEYEEIKSMIDLVTHDQEDACRMDSYHAPLQVYTIDEAIEGLFMPETRFRNILDLLRVKKNIILQGPPGVGKSFIARRIANAFIGFRDPANVEMIQFHQSYAYEDFIQGFRPGPDGRFILKDGVFFSFCRRAMQRPDLPFVFIIDEINRGNLSKIFGELMLLIEHDKRDPAYAIPLTYSGSDAERFYVPANVHLIGMMNTADRSLAMVDYALRRRFSFIGLAPAFGEPRFRAYLAGCGVDSGLITSIIERMTYLNDQIAGDSGNLGEGYCIGHSFFCPPGGDGTGCDSVWFQRVVQYEIEPLLMEYWFEDRDKTASAIRRLIDV